MDQRHFGTERNRITLRKRFRLFFNVIAVVIVLTLLKTAIHALHLEFLMLNFLFPSIVAGVIFIIGFLLSSILADYKESERLPADIRVALEAIHDDVRFFAERNPEIEIGKLRSILVSIVTSLQEALDVKAGHRELQAATARVDELSPVFNQLDTVGMPSTFVVRLRGQQDVLRKCLYRISHIQEMTFVPSVHVLVQTLVVATLFLLLFLETEGTFESELIFGFVSYMFVYALYLIDTLEKPFRKGHNSVDDVSLFLLRDFADKLRSGG